MKRIVITTDEIRGTATLLDTVTSDLIWDALPIAARANKWGEEIYFTIDVSADLEDPSEVVELGDLAYWPTGQAFCIFFGRTPASRGDEIRPASPVNVFAKLESDPKAFKAVADGSNVLVEKAE